MSIIGKGAARILGINLDEIPEKTVPSINWLEIAINCVEAEPELPGSMPDEIWDAIKNDRDATEELLRIVVRQTKAGIKERLLSNDMHHLEQHKQKDKE